MKTNNELINDINLASIPLGKIGFWWLGQMGYVIKIADKIIYIDAYLRENERRTVKPLLNPLEVVNADIIIGTHDHSDHIDREVWHELSLASPKAKFIVPNLVLKSLSEDLNIPEERFIGMDNGLEVNIDGIKIMAIASAHELLHKDDATGQYPFLGFIIESNDAKLYHSGDTCIYPGLYEKLLENGPYNAIFLPINGRDAVRYKRNTIGNMTYQEAVDLAGYLKPKLVVPGHYEMFLHNSEDPKLFLDYLEAKYEDIESWVGEHGELVLA